MREHLCRGKRVDNGDWVYGSIISPCVVVMNDDGDDVEIEGAFILDQDYPALYEPICFKEVHPETIGQFTGLMDKNGLKIFEGDILTWPSGDAGHVVYELSGCQFRIQSEGNTLHIGLNIGDKGQAVVTGNIHDK